MLYDKEKMIGTLLINDSDISTGFVNDLDGGMDFWPIGNINDNQIYMPVSVMDFQKALDEGKNNNISIKTIC